MNMTLLSFSDVSIHTPTQGVTKLSDVPSDALLVSIHTPTQGVTNSGKVGNLYGFVSIHTPTQGVTLYRRTASVNFLFQSTHPRRV